MKADNHAGFLNQIIPGDALAELRKMPDGFVQCCVTSPPYYSLRDYQIDGQIGLEETPEEYVSKLVAVFREVRRVLRDDGLLWLNIGDSYAANRNYQVPDSKWRDVGNYMPRQVPTGLKPKDLMMIPARVALALQADGYYLRSDIIWHKPTAMPESVTDRPTSSHEHIFLFAKNERYYYDAQAIAEPSVSDHPSGNGFKRDPRLSYLNADGTARGNEHQWQVTPTRNKRNVWTVNTRPYSEAHFATFPEKLIEPCVLAGTSPRACEHCLAPWERVTERIQFGKAPSDTRYTDEKMQATRLSGSRQAYRAMGLEGPPAPITTGWQPTCSCSNNTGSGKCTVLDCFLGAGTTALVALQHNRNYLGIELNPEYVALAQKRIATIQPVLWEVSA